MDMQVVDLLVHGKKIKHEQLEYHLEQWHMRTRLSKIRNNFEIREPMVQSSIENSFKFRAKYHLGQYSRI